MNKTINKFLSTKDKFMPELHLKQPGFTYSACGTFTKHRERIQGFRETGNLNHLELTKLLEVVIMMDIKEYLQVWSIRVWIRKQARE